MDDSQIKDLLINYRKLLERVDGHILSVEQKYPDHIACKKGCDSCCRFLNLFPVEAFALAQAFVLMPIQAQTDIANHIEQPAEKTDKPCPLLIKHSCALYSDRPIICRTHGYPIFIQNEQKSSIDFCAGNFKGITNFPKDALLSIDQLNTTLTAINQLFRESIETDTPLPDRIPISSALFLLSEQD